MWPKRRAPEQVPEPADLLVDVDVPRPASSPLEALIAEVRASWQRALQRNLWSKAAVRELLRGAVLAGIGDVKQGRDLFEKATVIFDEDVQTRNRMFYVVGLVLGVLIVALVTAIVIAFAMRWPVFAERLAKPSTVISLFAFAGMGSLTSVLIRLSTIDLRKELRTKFVVMSGAARPLVAICFASVVYVILTYKIVAVQLSTASGGDIDYTFGVVSAAAFLCGFSERFATDLLDQIPFPRRSPPAGDANPSG